MLSAIIFDLDGVLADSEPWWSEIDAKLLAEHGVTYRGEYHQNVVGVSYRLVVEFYKKAFGLSVPTEEMMRRRGEIATEFFADRVDLFPDVKEVLEKLRADEIASRRRHEFGRRVCAPVPGSTSTNRIFRGYCYRRRS